MGRHGEGAVGQGLGCLLGSPLLRWGGLEEHNPSYPPLPSGLKGCAQGHVGVSVAEQGLEPQPPGMVPIDTSPC